MVVAARMAFSSSGFQISAPLPHCLYPQRSWLCQNPGQVQHPQEPSILLFLFGETFFFLYYIIRTDFLILLYRLFSIGSERVGVFSPLPGLRDRQFCLADYIFSNSRRRLCRMPVVCVGLFPSPCLLLASRAFCSERFFRYFHRLMRTMRIKR